MRTSRRIGKLGPLLVLLLFLSSLPVHAASLLDGRTFAGETGEVGKATGEMDGFIFKDGTFRSTACDQYAFNAAPYTATKGAGGVIAFTVTTTSPKEGRMDWKGTVQGDAIDGTVSWSKAGQRTIAYWFKGAVKKPNLPS